MVIKLLEGDSFGPECIISFVKKYVVSLVLLKTGLCFHAYATGNLRRKIELLCLSSGLSLRFRLSVKSVRKY